MTTETTQQTLRRILQELQSSDVTRQIGALDELETLNTSHPEILREVERLVIRAEDDGLRQRASELLESPIHRRLRKSSTPLNSAERQLILREIKKWEEEGLLELGRAEVIRQRYNFDSAPLAPFPQPVQTPPPAAPQAPAVPAQPRPSLMQTLLSEASVKVYLYLGAFFVIASALILAAVVEAARLPILLAATFAFGGGAFVIRKRLPQPSFALFIVFSFLLPIDANVLEETIGFQEPALSIYWTLIFLMMALIWGLSIWFYESRFFSLVAFVAMSLAFYRAAQIFQTEAELQIFFGILASLASLAGTHLIKRWKDNRFALPVFLLAQIQVLGLLLISLALAIVHAFDLDITNGWWLLTALTWIAAAAFFAASNFLFPFVLFPWMAVTALLPLPWFLLNAFDLTQPAYSVGFWLWGAALAAVSEVLHRQDRFRVYGWASLAGSVPVFLTAAVIAIDWDQPPLTFLTLAGTALVYAGLHILRPRWYVWSAALLGALFAYFTFFTLPAINRFDVPVVYQLLGASILLTLPELFARTPLTVHNQSRIPALVLGGMVSFVCMGWALIDIDYPGRTALAFLAFTALLTLYAFHFNRSWIGYFAIASEVLAVLYTLNYLEQESWLPVLTLLSVLHYAVGFLLRRRTNANDWAPVLINSGLVLGALLTAATLIVEKETAGWYILAIAALFAAETFARPWAWLELAVEVLLSLALFRILVDLDPPHAMQHALFGISLIWLGGDMIFSRLTQKRTHRPITLAVGYLFLAVATLLLLIGLDNSIAVIYYLVYAVFFAVYAISQRKARLAYFTLAFLPLAVIKFYEISSLEAWMLPLIALAVLYYAIGFVLRRSQKASDWEIPLLNGGLVLGIFTSLSAPFQGGVQASIPIAIAATLFAAEAFALRNVWWALPANGLYLLAYFVLLRELQVDEPQFYSIGAALLGMLMHYLLTRAGSKTGAFVMGMLSQLVLLGTTYIQMVSANELRFFFILFAQSMLVLVYGLLQRSRSLVITPIAFAVLGVVTVVYSALKGLSSVILIGCTGILLLLLGIAAVLLRERITRLGEQLSDWKP